MASTKSSLTHSMELSSTHCKYFDNKDYQHTHTTKTEAKTLCWSGLWLFFSIKNCVAVNKSYVRLNKDWCLNVFFLCPILMLMGTRYLQTSCHLKIMLIFLSVKWTKQKVEKKLLLANATSEVTCLTFTCVFCRILRDNRYLSDIQEDAFEGSMGPSFL